ncbi:MAG: class I SAM-dependent methyltransferase, partial [Lachnospiraceae bacterium]|nr:class I SAM-dependent methyltransferase [Lachnospiraceae bacterium]
YEKVEKNINALVESNVNWSACATPEEMQKAREGQLSLKFFDKEIPTEWLKDINGKKVLCLAGAGGLQAPLLACAGAEVTVLDLSEKMLEKDRNIANTEHLNIRIEKGNMCDLSRFSDDSFDYIVNPTSLMYVPDVRPVFKECYRVLKAGGIFIMAAPNPINYMCDFVNDENGGYYKAVNRMPYCSSDFDEMGDWVEYGHTMEDYIGGQIECGFVINGYVECQLEDITELHFLTRAVKCNRK